MFQSTHPRRVRPFVRSKIASRLCFNPRTHVGCDERLAFLLTEQEGFNPRTHVGCDSLLE